MNKLVIRTALTLIVLLIVGLIGHKMILKSIANQRAIEEIAYVNLQNERKILESNLKNYARQPDLPLKKSSVGRLLKPGEESRLLKSSLTIASAADITVRGFSLHRSWQARKTQEKGGAEIQSRLQSETTELPQLDENGMPIGSIDEDEEETFVEIVPASLQLEGRYSSFGKFFDMLAKQLPLSAVQAMILDLDGLGIVRGEMRLAFPLMKYGDNSVRR